MPGSVVRSMLRVCKECKGFSRMTLQGKIVCDNPPSGKLDVQTVSDDDLAHGNVGAAAVTSRIAILLAGTGEPGSDRASANQLARQRKPIQTGLQSRVHSRLLELPNRFVST